LLPSDPLSTYLIARGIADLDKLHLLDTIYCVLIVRDVERRGDKCKMLTNDTKPRSLEASLRQVPWPRSLVLKATAMVSPLLLVRSYILLSAVLCLGEVFDSPHL
jgi:hypothetical protein